MAEAGPPQPGWWGAGVGCGRTDPAPPLLLLQFPPLSAPHPGQEGQCEATAGSGARAPAAASARRAVMSCVRAQPGSVSAPSLFATHLGAVAPDEAREKAGRGSASPEQTPLANTGCRAGSRRRAGLVLARGRRQGLAARVPEPARAPSLGTLGITPPLGWGSWGSLGVQWVAHAELLLRVPAEGQDDPHPKASPRALSRCWHRWCMPGSLSPPGCSPLLLGHHPRGALTRPWSWCWGATRYWT